MIKKFLLLAALSAWPAVANTIIVSSTNAALGENVYIYDNGVNQSVWAGGIDIKVNAYTRLAFCIELLVDINLYTTYNTTLDFSGSSTNVERVAWLLQNDYPTDRASGAGFQLAIWDIMTDNGDGFTKGLVRSTTSGTATDGAVLANAAKYELDSKNLESTTQFVVYHNTTVIGGTPAQALMGRWPGDGGPVPATPEPASIVLIFSGFALIGLSRLRQARR